jgi:hypothetical protein
MHCIQEYFDRALVGDPTRFLSYLEYACALENANDIAGARRIAGLAIARASSCPWVSPLQRPGDIPNWTRTSRITMKYS